MIIIFNKERGQKMETQDIIKKQDKLNSEHEPSFTVVIFTKMISYYINTTNTQIYFII